MTDASTPGDVAASIVEMQALLLGTETIQEFLAELAGLAILTVGEGLSCGITLQPNGRPLTVASTDALAAQVDEVQYGLDQGPCLHALRTGTTVYWPATIGGPPTRQRPFSPAAPLRPTPLTRHARAASQMSRTDRNLTITNCGITHVSVMSVP